jgi:hypothetical protein
MIDCLASIHRLNLSDHLLGRRTQSVILEVREGVAGLPLTFLRLVRMSLLGILAGGLPGGR